VSDRSATVEVLTRRVEQLAAGDPDSTRLVYAMVVALLVVGLLLVLLAVWVIRRTRTDLALLAPLERMSDTKGRKSDPDGRRALLDEVRPPGATPPPWPRPQDPATASALPPPAAGSDGVGSVEPAVEPVIDPLGPGLPDPIHPLVPSGDLDPPSVATPPEPPAEPDSDRLDEPDALVDPAAADVDGPPDLSPEPVAIVVPAAEPGADGGTPDAAPDDASVER
jgi:hypothetical protein